MVSRVIAFYSKIGSTDRPRNFSPDLPFAFDIDDPEKKAVFKYSINDVERAFNTPREFVSAANWSATSTLFLGNQLLATNSLLVECGKISKDEDYSSLATENVQDSFWTNVFKCAEFIGNNQATVTQSPWSSGFTSYGDSALGSINSPDGTVNQYYIPIYVQGSLIYKARANSTRLESCTFSLNHPQWGRVSLQIYFDADAFCERSASVSYSVWRYVDLDNDSVISHNEMDVQIVNKIFTIMKENNYKYYSNLLIDKRISNTEMTTEQFFVFTSLAKTDTNDPLSSDIMKNKIKEYLMEQYPGDSNKTYLRYTYPTLFSENEVRIYPIWDNFISESDGGSRLVHPLSFEKYASVMAQYGWSISTSSSEYRSNEIFYIGPGSGWSPSVGIKFPQPLIAVEVDPASGIKYPISSRFPDYRPIYGENLSSSSSEFHFILLNIMSYLENAAALLTSDFIDAYSISESAVNSRKVITFNFANDLWSVYGPIGSAA